MIISGKELSAKLKAEMAAQVSSFPEKYGRVPHLVVILVGDDPASVSYVTGKAKASQVVGIENTTIRRPSDISEEELLCLIPKGIIKMLKAAGVEIKGKRAVVIGRSNIVGLPVAKLLLDENATVTIAHSRTADLPSVTREADILVVAIGRPRFVTADMVKQGAAVIDVGVNRDPETGKLCGDVDFAAIEPEASVITPVPGGVGPMTICCLMENTIECFLNKMAPKRV